MRKGAKENTKLVCNRLTGIYTTTPLETATRSIELEKGTITTTSGYTATAKKRPTRTGTQTNDPTTETTKVIARMGDVA